MKIPIAELVVLAAVWLFGALSASMLTPPQPHTWHQSFYELYHDPTMTGDSPEWAKEK